MIKHLKLLFLLVVLVFPFVQNWTPLEILKLKTKEEQEKAHQKNRRIEIIVLAVMPSCM